MLLQDATDHDSGSFHKHLVNLLENPEILPGSSVLNHVFLLQLEKNLDGINNMFVA